MDQCADLHLRHHNPVCSRSCPKIHTSPCNWGIAPVVHRHSVCNRIFHTSKLSSFRFLCLLVVWPKAIMVNTKGSKASALTVYVSRIRLSRAHADYNIPVPLCWLQQRKRSLQAYPPDSKTFGMRCRLQ